MRKKLEQRLATIERVHSDETANEWYNPLTRLVCEYAEKQPLSSFLRFSGKSHLAPYARVWNTMDDHVRTDERARCRMFYFLESRSTVRSVEFPPRYITVAQMREADAVFLGSLCVQRWDKVDDDSMVRRWTRRRRRREDGKMRRRTHGLGMPSRPFFFAAACGSTWFAVYTSDRKFRAN